MPRPNKTGLDYFPLDVDFFEDEKIEFIKAEFGIKGEIIALRLLCKIYRNGYWIKWGEDESLLMASRVGEGFTGAFVLEVVKGLVRRCFFDKRCFNSFQILTSPGIQSRYFSAVDRRQTVNIVKEYTLISVYDYINEDNVNIYSINTDSGTQSRVKESRVKESKELLDARAKVFFDQVAEFVGKYPKQMLRAFYDYWTEVNKSGTKMKFEMEKTWQLSKRIKRWADNDKSFSGKKEAEQAPNPMIERLKAAEKKHLNG